ncbi:gamma-butyrolactone biosynthesis protein [Nocardia terpenica]|uniref:ScbA/BarX family gamma-butyrolactone biosynthesis protein n=1 Tax=Nocardia terpenica TaxID=455432 RepID=UPI00189388DB|nr:ScbA/BarX family gamma-butyrolactone biosynthesis protein [Nocardia terpenica]MBF6061540.1 gamma-butyrolactone biosynthesis protein [Nocardia terpenica]MBF6105231.1 gamma-butyrolactone biosynthesis protein [Nocardia terpenica]MBF6113299.1 gamma-butyrolactone biosynthesis protein [Nocardia terpenica]MBF6119429.1 gamma-butyrolactone biosynthesis protein [Nocardia terpenica]MBF6153077.1 gamma-butyrolactone biosynthesis protein [Nocardia terpenica]
MTTDTARPATATHTRTISRHLAHRCAVSEVFVTSLHANTEDSYTVGAQLPRMHAYYGDHLGPAATHYDPLLVMEAARQAAIALTHEYFGIPQDMAFVVRTFNGSGADTAAWRIGPTPADLVMSVQITRRHQRAGRVHGVDMVLDIGCGGVPMMTVDGSFTWITPTQWDRLRDSACTGLGLGEFDGEAVSGARAEPQMVGRENRRNVVIGPLQPHPAGGTAVLVADTGHPVLFDHPLDHAPGSLLIEAARQTATALLGPNPPQLLCVAATFEKFVELDTPAECVAEIVHTDPRVVRCTIHQADTPAARIDLEFAEVPEQ